LKCNSIEQSHTSQHILVTWGSSLEIPQHGSAIIHRARQKVRRTIVTSCAIAITRLGKYKVQSPKLVDPCDTVHFDPDTVRFDPDTVRFDHNAVSNLQGHCPLLDYHGKITGLTGV
jgi:hypothetical protein